MLRVHRHGHSEPMSSACSPPFASEDQALKIEHRLPQRDSVCAVNQREGVGSA